MTLKEASKHALTILKQVMEEKLNATNIEVYFNWLILNKVFGANYLNIFKSFRCQPFQPETKDFTFFLKKKLTI